MVKYLATALLVLLGAMGCHTTAQVQPEGCPDRWVVGNYTDDGVLQAWTISTWNELAEGVEVGEWAIQLRREDANIVLLIRNDEALTIQQTRDPRGKTYTFVVPDQRRRAMRLKPGRSACSWLGNHSGYLLVVVATK